MSYLPTPETLTSFEHVKTHGSQNPFFFLHWNPATRRGARKCIILQTSVTPQNFSYLVARQLDTLPTFLCLHFADPLVIICRTTFFAQIGILGHLSQNGALVPKCQLKGFDFPNFRSNISPRKNGVS